MASSAVALDGIGVVVELFGRNVMGESVTIFHLVAAGVSRISGQL